MNTVKIKTPDLLAKVVTNRKKHTDTFAAAEKAYRRKAVAGLRKLLRTAERGGKIVRALHLVEPVNKTEDYDTAIAMLRMTTEKEIELTQEQFRELVLDKWHWQEQVSASNSAYLSAKYRR